VTAPRVFSFYGVTTGSSSIMRLFPCWAEHLGLVNVKIEGTDLPIHADPEIYRARVMQLKEDPNELGALVTTHKIDLYRACLDLFDEVDPLARLCGEESCLSKRDARLRAHAKDPISAGQSLDDMLPQGYWARTGGDVLCIGAGGSAIAIALHLLTRRAANDRPRRIVVSNRSRPRLDSLKTILGQLDNDVPVEYITNEDPHVNDGLMAALADGSLVINATGRGKDTPGSPITDDGIFPRMGVVWELNYRGELDFLHQALAQARERELRVYDGWSYFIYGWTAVIEEVFDLELTRQDLDELAKIANDMRAGSRAGASH
jgi:shikimate 5-dehydrogenase